MLGDKKPLRLKQWAWLQTGKDRRLIGWDTDASAWVISSKIAAVPPSSASAAPSWATTADHREVQLSDPARGLLDEMLEAIDRMRAEHPYFKLLTTAPVSLHLWRPASVLDGGTARRSA
ncbi:hypothetical protein [Azospirillum sp. SYSU D00513]|uniref:hypothetical protein n=1 Tax=Azospirillum sp. SYSU D00513 TaxID=2812561 RepID=UPI001A960E3A|nr:hypothetical protein [Azospirillum sp. SYSU D00513]